MKGRNSTAWLKGFLFLVICSQPLMGQWPQFGGPTRDFTVTGGPLSTDWGDSGPRLLWKRDFGDGFASLLVDQGVLYAARRDGEQDVIVAMEADTGKEIWSTSYHSPTLPDMILDFGPGPITTPLLAGDRLFTVSSTVKFHCLDRKTGKILWAHDLMQEMGAPHLGRGFGPSPIAYQDTVILTVGGKEASVVAFDQETGEVVWKSQDFGTGYSAPILGDVDGETQLLVSLRNHRAGLDPATGELRWHLELAPSAGSMMATQHWGPDNLLFGSSAYADGSRALEVRKTEGGFEARELWYSRKMRVMFPCFVRIGDYVYGSSGDFGPIFLMAINVRNGEVSWRERGFGRTHFVRVGDQVLLLEEEGELAVATLTPEAMTVHARAHVIERTAWTPPTVVAGRVYLRNRMEIRVLDLNPDDGSASSFR